jgi:hypothetical protein
VVNKNRSPGIESGTTHVARPGYRYGVGNIFRFLRCIHSLGRKFLELSFVQEPLFFLILVLECSKDQGLKQIALTAICVGAVCWLDTVHQGVIPKMCGDEEEAKT